MAWPPARELLPYHHTPKKNATSSKAMISITSRVNVLFLILCLLGQSPLSSAPTRLPEVILGPLESDIGVVFFRRVRITRMDRQGVELRVNEWSPGMAG
jgi:hypothetical protein